MLASIQGLHSTDATHKHPPPRVSESHSTFCRHPYKEPAAVAAAAILTWRGAQRIPPVPVAAQHPERWKSGRTDNYAGLTSNAL